MLQLLLWTFAQLIGPCTRTKQLMPSSALTSPCACSFGAAAQKKAHSL